MKSSVRIYLVLLVAFLVTVPGMAGREFSTRGEPREALVAQAMISTGDWILPSGYGGSVPSKPPLTHWIMALASLPGGEVTEFTARFPSALASILLVLSLFLFLRKRCPEQEAFWAVIILATTLEWLRASSGARVDMVLAACLSGGLLSLYCWEERKLKGFPALAVILLTGATLTKGPVGMALPGAIFGLYLLVRKYPLKEIFIKLVPVFFLVLILSLTWYALAFMQGADAFVDKIYYENVARLTSTMDDEPHKHSAFYLYGALILGTIPWVIPWLCGVVSTLKKPAVKLSTFLNAKPFVQFSIITALFIVAFFSIPSSKRSVYLLPAYPFISYLLAKSFLELTEKGVIWVKRGVSSILGLLLIVQLGAAAVILDFVALSFLKKPSTLEKAQYFVGLIRDISDPISIALLLLPLGFTLGALIAEVKGKPSLERTLTSLLGSIVLLVLAYNAPIGKVTARGLSPKSFSSDLASHLPSTAKIYSFKNEFYAISFYLKHRIDRFNGSPESGSYVLSYRSDLDELNSIRFEEVLSSTGFVVKPGEQIVLLKVL